MRMNFSKYCWKIERHAEHRLDLVLYCAPGLAKGLCAGLPASWGFRPHSDSSVRTASVDGFRACLMGIETDDDELRGLVEEYARLASGLRRGKKQSEEYLTGLRVVCRAILEYTELGTIRPR